jgi:hypothetical protein
MPVWLTSLGPLWLLLVGSVHLIERASNLVKHC